MNITHTTTKEIENIMHILTHMKRSKKNHALLTEYFLHEIATNPETLIHIIARFKYELANKDNPHREKLARRYLHIFSFLCERFGLYEDKLELDDMCFFIDHPNEYKKLKKDLENYQKNASSIIDQVKSRFDEEISTSGLEFEIKGRYKNLYSIYKKCQKKKIAHAVNLGDIFAFRIIIDGDSSNCYEVLNILHDAFIPLPHRFKDYVSIPKINGYQSLHTGLIGILDDLDMAIEVQIRTEIMDEVAESGIAAHFLYAKDKSAKRMTEKEQKLLDHLEEVAESVRESQYIYCMTPVGDILRLKRGSTAKDFAYKIHSKLAEKATGVRINKTKKKLLDEVQNFDTVEIVTA